MEGPQACPQALQVEFQMQRPALLQQQGFEQAVTEFQAPVGQGKPCGRRPIDPESGVERHRQIG
jgi:hypothetical protein